jgi:hypothetical protein
MVKSAGMQSGPDPEFAYRRVKSMFSMFERSELSSLLETADPAGVWQQNQFQGLSNITTASLSAILTHLASVPGDSFDSTTAINEKTLTTG